ncbi:MAG: 5'-methylthioadenosine/S-adenosylhomocysteine nucleosidase [Burkholderiaceae bacterium]
MLLALLLALAPWWLAGCAAPGPRAAAPACLSECTPRIGVMAAFGQEADLLVAQMQDVSERRINGNRFVLGRLQGLPVVLVLSGVSLPNAVMVSQLMLDHFRVTQLVFSVIAGGIDPRHQVGDIVIPQAWALQQETYYAASPALPKPCGTTAGDLSCLGLALDDMRTPYGDGQFLRKTNVLNSANWQQVALRDSLGGAPVAHGEMRSRYPVDAAMLATLRAALPAINGALEPLCVPGQACSTPHASVSALGVSGSSFVAHPGYREYLHRQLGAGSVDMETAGVAHVAYANQVPFLAFRSLSDLAGSDEHPERVGQFFSSGMAQRNAARVTLGFLKAWAAR